MKQILKRLAFKVFIISALIGLVVYSALETMESVDLKAQLRGTGDHKIAYVQETVQRLHDFTCKEIEPIAANNNNFDDWDEKSEVALIDFRCSKGVFMTQDDWYTVSNYLNWTLPIDEQLALIP